MSQPTPVNVINDVSGEEEGIDNVPQLIESANTSKMGVDWMLAYMELHSLVDTMKKAEASSVSARSGWLSWISLNFLT